MNIIELFGLDIKELQAFLFRWGIDVEINYLQAFTDIIIFIISLILLYKYTAVQRKNLEHDLN